MKSFRLACTLSYGVALAAGLDFGGGGGLRARQSPVKTVNTTSGPVSGHPANNASTVSEYLGIPYAMPPVGDLRWAPPVRYNGTAAINGTNFVCHQSFAPLK